VAPPPTTLPPPRWSRNYVSHGRNPRGKLRWPPGGEAPIAPSTRGRKGTRKASYAKSESTTVSVACDKCSHCNVVLKTKKRNDTILAQHTFGCQGYRLSRHSESACHCHRRSRRWRGTGGAAQRGWEDGAAKPLPRKRPAPSTYADQASAAQAPLCKKKNVHEVFDTIMVEWSYIYWTHPPPPGSSSPRLGHLFFLIFL